MSNVRIRWIDNLKGLAIVAVVLGHMASPISGFIYSWHIPLFFFASGILINRSGDISESVKKDFKRLIVPFLVFSFIGLFFENIKRLILPSYPFASGNLNIGKEILGILFWMDYSHLHHYGFTLWFLPALFWAKNVYLVLCKYIKDNRILTVVSLVLLFLVPSLGFSLPFCLDKGIIGLFWISCFWLITGRFWLASFILTIFLPVSGLDIANSTINIYGVIYSVIAINAFVGFSKNIPKQLTIFEIFGKASMLILIIHPYINNISYWLTNILIKGNWILEAALSISMIALIVKTAPIVKIKLRNKKDIISSFIKQII